MNNQTTNIAFCKKPTLGDVQIETVLTPLLFIKRRPGKHEIWDHSIDDTHPIIRVLDLGCGEGRLFEGLQGFPNHLLRHIEYVGTDINQAALSNAKQLLEKQPRLKTQLRTSGFVLWSELNDLKKVVDFVFMINVLHHVEPADLPKLFADVSRLIKDGGCLVLHDFYFADRSSQYDFSQYCEDAIFFTPEHVSSFFAMASTQTGLFRTMRRRAKGGFLDLFTFVLYYDNELSHAAFEKSTWNDDYFSSGYVSAGLALSLEDLDHNCPVMLPNERLIRYQARLRDARSRVVNDWGRWLNDPVVTSLAEKWIQRRPHSPDAV